MLFNSIEFAIFLPVVFLVYWFAVNRNLKLQNIFLLFASYLFYGWWDWRFLFLLAALSLFNYLTGIRIDTSKSESKRKIWLITGLLVNTGVLCVFKYYNFFIDSFIDIISLTGYNLPETTTDILLPLGISFYIFLSLSYIIDVYKKSLKAGRDPVEVLLTLGFFPIILAGPIQRPSTLLPQIVKRREFSYEQGVDGLRQILWGLFVKIAIADNLAPHVGDVFSRYADYSGSTLLLGGFFYAIQIYADFSGYSNIAIGVGKLFGFSLMRNFAYPYFARDIIEFWKRWHMSLTAWFRDYIFLPLSFTFSWKIRNEKVLMIRTDNFIYISASAITWFLTGLWHGANYTFILWGLINGLFLIIYHLQRNPRKRLFKKLGISNNNLFIATVETIFTLGIILIAWIFFRSDTIPHALGYIGRMFSSSLFTMPQLLSAKMVVLIPLFLCAEWVQRNEEHVLRLEFMNSGIIRWCIYFTILFLILSLGGENQKFIYFQF
jgi:alginate O-acetyltransferase complex protein AlgI